jgi:hypothetical protein
MNDPMKGPDADRYRTDRIREAQQMADEMREERRKEGQARRKPIIIGVTGPADGMQSADN